MNSLLSIRNLTIVSHQDRKPILSDINLDVATGEVVALIGGSGAGKTTLALTALGYLRAGMMLESGSVSLGTSTVLSSCSYNKQTVRGNRVSYVAQSAAASFNPSLRLATQIAEPLVVHRHLEFSEALTRVEQLLVKLRLPDPKNLAHRYPFEVSGGQLQRAMTAMAVIHAPELIVFDEPTTALDVTTQVEVLLTIKDLLKGEARSALYVTHDLAVVAQIADRCVVMKDGQIVEQGLTPDILFRPTAHYTSRLLSARSHETPGRQRSQNISSSGELKITGIAAGYPQTSRQGGLLKPVHKVLQNIDLSVKRGEVLAIVGESGSGKSTLARVIAGLHKPTTGNMSLDGGLLAGDLAERSKEARRRVQIVFQSPDSSLNPKATVETTLGRPLARFFGLSGLGRKERAIELLDMVGLDSSYLSRPVQALSGGQKQRVSIARALAAEPDYLVCDEVLSALDTIVARSIRDLLHKLQQQKSFGCLFISHDLEVVRGFADRVIVLYGGRICESGEAGPVIMHPLHPYTRHLVSSIPELRPGWLEEVTSDPNRAEMGEASPDAETEGCPFLPRCMKSPGSVCARPISPILLEDEDRQVVCAALPKNSENMKVNDIERYLYRDKRAVQ